MDIDEATSGVLEESWQNAAWETQRKKQKSYSKARKEFTRNFISELNTSMASTQIIIVSLGAGYSDAKKNNRKALEEAMKSIIEEDTKNNSSERTLLCFKKCFDTLKKDKFGGKREKPLNRVIFNFLDTRGRYISIIKSPELILKYAKQIILFVPRKIPQYMKFISPTLKCKHFVIVRKCTLTELSANSDKPPLPIKVIKRNNNDQSVSDWNAFDKPTSPSTESEKPEEEQHSQ